MHTVVNADAHGSCQAELAAGTRRCRTGLCCSPLCLVIMAPQYQSSRSASVKATSAYATRRRAHYLDTHTRAFKISTCMHVFTLV